MVYKTVDNLGADVSFDYARRQTLGQPAGYEEARKVMVSAQVDNYTPISHNQYDLLFNTNIRNAPWGGITKPPGFDSQQQRIYTYQVAPSLGTEELQELQLRRIDDKLSQFYASHPAPPTSDTPSSTTATGAQTDQQALIDFNQLQGVTAPQVGVSAEANLIIGDLLTTQREAEILKKLLELMMNLDKVLNEVNQKRKQYQKG
ncbi:MAG: DUF5399 family protein [Chlamydiales bacterium]|nr:DUF5399 family protein [Chlamydiales bacterium]